MPDTDTLHEALHRVENALRIAGLQPGNVLLHYRRGDSNPAIDVVLSGGPEPYGTDQAEDFFDALDVDALDYNRATDGVTRVTGTLTHGVSSVDITLAVGAK